MRSIKQIKNLKGKTVLLRVAFNVPIKNGKVLDDFRIKKAMPTINFLKRKGAKIILISHRTEKGATLRPVAKYLNMMILLDRIKLEIISDSEAITGRSPGEAPKLPQNLRRSSRYVRCFPSGHGRPLLYRPGKLHGQQV